MLDLAIVLGLIVLNALVHSAYVRWRNAPKTRRVPGRVGRRNLAYPIHPSPGFTDMPEHAIAVRPAGMDW